MALWGAGVSYTLAGLSYWAYHSQHRKIDAIRSAVQVPIEDAEQLVSSTPGGCIPYAVVTGTVNADSDISCLYNTTQRGVAYILTLKEHKAEWSSGTKAWQNVVRVLSESKRDVPFWIEPPTASSSAMGSPTSRIAVSGWDRASGLSLPVVYDKFEPAASTATQSVVDYMRGELKKGIEHVEQVLPRGTRLTVVGELARAAPDVPLAGSASVSALTATVTVIRPPSNGTAYYASTRGIDVIIEQEVASSTVWKWVGVACAAVGSAFILYRLKRVYSAWRESRKRDEMRREMERLRREALSPSTSPLSSSPSTAAPKPSGGGSEGSLSDCVVCWSRPSNAVLLDCGHLCVCAECSENLTQCPLCRGTIARVVRAFT